MAENAVTVVQGSCKIKFTSCDGKSSDGLCGSGRVWTSSPRNKPSCSSLDGEESPSRAAELFGKLDLEEKLPIPDTGPYLERLDKSDIYPEGYLSGTSEFVELSQGTIPWSNPREISPYVRFEGLRRE